MRAESSCFGFQAPPTDGLFFALFPDRKAAQKLGTTAQQLCIRHRLSGRPLRPERLHVSLLGLGRHAGLPREVVAAALAAAGTIAASSFAVTFDRAMSFLGEPRPLVLSGQSGLAELITFQQRLARALEERGFGGVKQRYVPHVTLVYDERGVDAHAIEPPSPGRCANSCSFTVSSAAADTSFSVAGRSAPRSRLPGE